LTVVVGSPLLAGILTACENVGPTEAARARVFPIHALPLVETGDTAENGSGWWFNRDSMRITISSVTGACTSPNATLIFSYPPSTNYYLTSNACGELGRTFMQHAFLPSDSTSFGFTTHGVLIGSGTGNLRWGKYPTYYFGLKNDAYGTYGDYVVRADVFPCNLTGDSLLDIESIRDSLKAAFARSNADSAPGTMKRREVGGVIFRHTDPATGARSYYFKEPSSYAVQTACRNEWSVPAPNTPGDVPVAGFHTHPNIASDTVYGCQPGTKQFPGGPGVVAFAGNHANAGGGSTPDWAFPTNTGSPMYTMGKDSVVWRLDPGVAPAAQPANPRHWRWKKTPGGCRGW
jgi:hypothetical protein